jgi:hypothetical protein
MNGHFDLAKPCSTRAPIRTWRRPTAPPLYAALNCQWSDKALIRSRAPTAAHASYLGLMKSLLEKGAVNTRLRRRSGVAR